MAASALEQALFTSRYAEFRFIEMCLDAGITSRWAASAMHLTAC